GAPLQSVPGVRPPAPGAVLLGQHARGVVPCHTHLAREGRMTVTIGRRELLVALGGAAAAGPLAARAQQGGRVRRAALVKAYRPRNYPSIPPFFTRLVYDGV